MFGNRQRLTVIIAAHAIAVAIGFVAPSAIASLSPEAVYADHNCTRYGPFSYLVNQNCSVNDPMDPCCVEGWKTNGFAQRDFNEIRVTGTGRPLFLKLDGNGWAYAWAEGWGLYFGDLRSSALQARAYCTMNGTWETNGGCTVWWD